LLVQLAETNDTRLDTHDSNMAKFEANMISSPPPAQNDPQWNQWRRDQVSNMVR
jgi:uncharacterized lipoprotein YddW (UPF0748 family)